MKKMNFKKTALTLASCLLLTAALSACGQNADPETTAADETAEAATNEDTSATQETAAPQPAAVTSLKEQGNPTTIALSDIAESSSDGDFKAWIKVSTQYDPNLSVYSYDLIPSDAEGIIVTFTVSDMDTDEATLYWCYQLETADSTVSVWDTSSPADTLTITGDGTYTMVFNARTALGAPISVVDSLQIVFPGLTETTTTTFSFDGAWATTDESDLSLYTTGSVE